MTQLDVDPQTYYDAYYDAAACCDDAAVAVFTVLAAVSRNLLACGGMAGSDDGGAAWAASYDERAITISTTGDDVVEAVENYAGLLRTAGFNHAAAEADSTLPVRRDHGPARRPHRMVHPLNHVDGTADSSLFVQNDADFRYIELTTRTAWTATIEAAALLDSFETPAGQLLPVEPWDGMATWLIESMTDTRPGMIIGLGPNTDIPEDEIDDFELVNAQVHVLEDGVFSVRRSRRILRQQRLVDHSVAGLELDL